MKIEVSSNVLVSKSKNCFAWLKLANCTNYMSQASRGASLWVWLLIPQTYLQKAQKYSQQSLLVNIVCMLLFLVKYLITQLLFNIVIIQGNTLTTKGNNTWLWQTTTSIQIT